MPYVGQKPADIISTAVDTVTGKFSGEVDAASLDISGNIDVDGTTNLDVVDIDGAVDMASTLQVDGAITASANMTITTADNNAQLTLKSTDADANSGPALQLKRDSSSPAADDFIGDIDFIGENNASQEVVYAEMTGRIEDVTDGAEDGRLILKTMRAGQLRSAIDCRIDAIVINEDSDDVDFRVESNGNANALLVAGNTDDIFFGCSALPSAGGGGAAFELSQSNARSILQLGNTGTSNLRVTNFYNGNGNIGNISLSGSTTSFVTSSDYRLKENVVTDWDATTRLKQLKPSRFNFIADADTTVDGFLAHEVSSIVPEAVNGTKDEVDEDGNAVMQGIDQNKLVPLLVKSLQEALTEIDTLKTKVTALENA